MHTSTPIKGQGKSKQKGKRRAPSAEQGSPKTVRPSSAKVKSQGKSPAKGDVLSIRWKTDYYKAILQKLMDSKEISKETQKIEGRFDLRHVNFRKLTLEDISLKDACLNAISAYAVTLINCDLSASFVKKGDFEEAVLEGTTCVGTIFSGCSFKKTRWTLVNLEGAIAENCDFTGAQFVEVNVENAIFDNSNFSDLISPETIHFIGTPKSAKNLLMDPETLDKLKDSAFKQALTLQ